MIPTREWKSLVEDGKERALRKQGKLPSGIGRYAILSTIVVLNLIIINLYIKFGSFNLFQQFHRLSDALKPIKAGQEKIGQHKLGLGG